MNTQRSSSDVRIICNHNSWLCFKSRFCNRCLQECLRPKKPVCAVCRAALDKWGKAIDLEALIHKTDKPCKGCGQQVRACVTLTSRKSTRERRRSFSEGSHVLTWKTRSKTLLKWIFKNKTWALIDWSSKSKTWWSCEGANTLTPATRSEVCVH